LYYMFVVKLEVVSFRLNREIIELIDAVKSDLGITRTDALKLLVALGYKVYQQLDEDVMVTAITISEFIKVVLGDVNAGEKPDNAKG